ncbi:MAG: manganese efflux pump [Firmicutes bacterium]|nr:manganese efflux pump [[Eubacterium] siraeum]MCM1486927.1 manganese efflux pump [Bacillota bacterium]
MIFAEILLLIAALSVDSLAAAISYGITRIKISLWQTLVISLICSGFLVVSVAFAGTLSIYIPKVFTKLGSFLILFVIGAIKLLQKPENQQPEKLSVIKTVLFAVSMSLDGLAAGFGAGLAAEDNILTVGITACVVTFVTVFFGNRAGLKINKNAPAFVQRIGGAAIISVAICKLI